MARFACPRCGHTTFDGVSCSRCGLNKKEESMVNVIVAFVLGAIIGGLFGAFVLPYVWNPKK